MLRARLVPDVVALAVFTLAPTADVATYTAVSYPVPRTAIGLADVVLAAGATCRTPRSVCGHRLMHV